jgi:hypothetical protein
MCWVDLNQSFRRTDAEDDARLAGERAVDIANAVGDPSVLQQAEEHLAELLTTVGPGA